MSTTLGTLTSLIQDAVDDYSPETDAQIHRIINQVYREVGVMHYWQGLLKSVALTSTILPGDMERPYFVRPSDTDYLYFPISVNDQYTNERLYAWFSNMTVATPLLAVTDGVVTANGTSVTSTTGSFTASHIGEYVRIGESGGIYKIYAVPAADTLTLAQAYRGGASSTAQYLEIRPQGTLILGRSDDMGDAITDTGDTLFYLSRPIPLYNDYDVIPLPGTCEAIRIMALQRMLENDKYDTDSQRQNDNFMEAIGIMKAMEPTVGRERRARDQYGSVLRFGRIRGFERTNRSGRRILGI